MMQGTPYIYQGEELGMTNVHFQDRSELRDLESLDAYDRYTSEGRFSKEEMLRLISLKARDNARTPMQWSNQTHGGFTHGEPWMAVNPNHQDINAKEQLSRPDSVFHYYKQLIVLRKKYDIITTGNYTLLDENNPSVFAYLRTTDEEVLWVLCNFANQTVDYVRPDCIQEQVSTILISNYSDSAKLTQLRPYETLVGIRWSDPKRGKHD
jgi:oligo-1,6-glucosidase